ncbi:hypothetical protein [Mycobacterium shigaense]|uniref:CoA transferase n=1 Tax=Mycobacterium shigaense TaxID=722731 RepID=A0A1Z4EPL9_9MYCO|nr:hypothetical protein [Mycobacterium shigaense]MEA1121689.1 hypothetical protein [Mycobacterium shigaense]BAX94891.1 CoA transferase [Mycobacterium shigaense]
MLDQADIPAPRNNFRAVDGKWLAMSDSSLALVLHAYRAICRE